MVTLTLLAALLTAFLCRTFQLGILTGPLQYTGLFLIAAGILLREWAIVVLGNHFTVRVQADGKSPMVTGGPYRCIRHPSYTGSLLALTGIALAVGTWIGTILVLVMCLAAYEYRIRVEEEAMREAFGREFDGYKNRTGRLLPKF